MNGEPLLYLYPGPQLVMIGPANIYTVTMQYMLPEFKKETLYFLKDENGVFINRKCSKVR